MKDLKILEQFLTSFGVLNSKRREKITLLYLEAKNIKTPTASLRFCAFTSLKILFGSYTFYFMELKTSSKLMVTHKGNSYLFFLESFSPA